MFQTQASNQTIYRMVMVASVREKNCSNELIEVLCTPFRPHKHFLLLSYNYVMVSRWLYHLKLRQCTFQASDEAANFIRHILVFLLIFMNKCDQMLFLSGNIYL